MNVFVLSTGRCGSKTFFKACSYIKNYTSGHESNNSKMGEKRFDYDDQHIEIDNRLSWFLGRLDEKYGDEAFYVHLIRNKHDTAKSFNKRLLSNFSIIKAYTYGILNRDTKTIKECEDYYETVNSNIRLFLKDKSNVMVIHLESVDQMFPEFWNTINAEGDLDKAMNEFKMHHNRSKGYAAAKWIKYSIWRFKKIVQKIF